jgi:hypothetical protein
VEPTPILKRRFSRSDLAPEFLLAAWMVEVPVIANALSVSLAHKLDGDLTADLFEGPR